MGLNARFSSWPSFKAMYSLLVSSVDNVTCYFNYWGAMFSGSGSILQSSLNAVSQESTWEKKKSGLLASITKPKKPMNRNTKWRGIVIEWMFPFCIVSGYNTTISRASGCLQTLIKNTFLFCSWKQDTVFQLKKQAWEVLN